MKNESTPKPVYSKFYKKFKAFYWIAFSLIILQSVLILYGVISVIYGGNGWISIIINSLMIPINVNTMLSSKRNMRKEENELVSKESEKYKF